MTYQIELAWKVFSKLALRPGQSARKSNALFNVRGGRAFSRSLGGNFQTGYAPEVLEPTVNFHQALLPLKNRLGIKDKRYPFTIFLDYLSTTVQVNITIHRYNSVVCASVKVTPFVVDTDIDFAVIQDLESHVNLYGLVKQVLGIAATGDARAKPLQSPPKFFPVVRVCAIGPDVPNWKSRLVAALTRHEAPSDVIVESVLAKNKPHQIDESLILIDRQGVFGYVPATCSAKQSRGNLQRFTNASALIEFAYAIRYDVGKGLAVDEDTRRAIESPIAAVPDSVSAKLMWDLIVREFSLQNELQRESEKVNSQDRERILLATVTDIETRAVLKTFAVATSRTARPIQIDGYIYQSLGQLGNFDIYLSRCEMGTTGLGGSQETIRRSLQAVKPSYVFMVGIGFGIDEEKQPIGQILVSKQLLLYDLQRVNNDLSIELRGDKPASSSQLLNWVKSASLTWRDDSQVKDGLILSGDKLVDNLDFRERLKLAAPDAIGGEMEGAGLYIACQNAKVDWILIKAVCDWADGNKSLDKRQRQETAAMASSEFVAHVLKVASC